MEEPPVESQTLFPHETGHHRSARERQRKGPMWGCLKALLFLFAGVFILLFLVIGGGFWYVGTSSFAGLVRLRIEQTLESRLGRDVFIKSVVIVRSRPQKVILNDLRIANAPGAVSPYFATVGQVVITGGIESFWRREIKVGRVDIIDPRMNFEVFPEGSPLTHNFPRWKTGPRRKHEIVHLDIGRLFVTNGAFLFLDRRHDISAEATRITSQVTVTRAEDLYEGVLNSPIVRVRLQDYEPFDVDMRGGFRYTPGTLALKSIAVRGRGIEAFVSGKLQPLTEGVYDLRLTSQVELERVREIFRVEKLLEGTLSLDTNLRGRQGNFHLTGGWVAARIGADTYELSDAKGRLDVSGERTLVHVESARYGGGTVKADYTLSKYSEPYPMTVDLRYERISIEQLFADWGVDNTGLRGAATGRLGYRWNKDRVLAGSGSGTATLARNATAFSRAKYPIPIAGSTAFALDSGTITFRSAELDTAASHVSLTGKLRIEDLFTDFGVRIRSSDFSELDRLAYNFAHAADKKDFELLGLGGSGEITGTVRGPLKTPDVVAQISGSGTKYNDVLLGSANIDLRYEGRRSLLTFERAVFTDGNGRLVLTGTIEFPDRGPSPRFDIAVEATNYPVDRAVAAVGLDFKIGGGAGTGKLLVTGTPDAGKVTFVGMRIARSDASELRLAGDVVWRPGEGNVTFDLDIDARDFPVADIIAFLDLGDLPVTGDITGKLHISGPKKELEGEGQVTVRRGTIYGEPVDVATADIVFTKGLLRARNVSVTAPAGQITGEAEFNLATERFSYTITSSSIDLSRLKLLEPLRDLLGGTITLSSSGAGTLDQPELVLEATLHEATIRGLALPPGSAPPSLYIAIRGGQLVVRGAIADIVSIEGQGTVGENLEVDGNVRITVSDIARLVALSPKTATLPAAGNLVVDMRLGGRLSPVEALRIDATFPTFDVRLSDHQFAAPQPLRVAFRDGRVVFESFRVEHERSGFEVTGFAEVVGERRLGLQVRGNVEAALLQLFMTGVRADGHLTLDTAVEGTLAAPVITGTAELQDAQVRFAGFPQLIDNIFGTVTFAGDQIKIESLRATVGGGTVIAGGTVAIEGFRPQRAQITLQGDDVALRYFEGVTVEGDFTLGISGDLERVVVQGDVAVTRALYSRDFDLQQAILNVVLSRTRIVPLVAANWQQRVDLRVHLDAPGTLAVRNNIAEVTGSADLELTGTLAEPVILGTVDLDEGGQVTFQNVEYRVVRGTINFQNPFRIDPYFDVTLEGRVSGGISEVESGPIDLTVNFTGTLDRMTPSITSDPPASDITLFSLLGFGGLTRNGTSDQSASLVGQSLLYSSVLSAIGQRILPFADSFTYDPGLLDTGSGAGPKVTFEKRVSNDIRLLVVYNLNDHESREVIEWQATRDWTLQFTRDEAEREYRAEARFRRRYRGHWTWGSLGRGSLFDVGSVAEALEIAPLPPATRVNAVPPGIVAQINYRADGGFDTSILGQYVTVEPGKPLTRRDIQASIKALFATGNFRDIRVDAETRNEGTVVTFALSLNYRVGRIHFEGVAGRDRRRAEREMTIRVGEVLSLNDVEDSANAIREELNQFGYLEATVDPETNFIREQNLADVTFHVTLGLLAKVGTVTIEGDLAPFTEGQLIEAMRQKPGKRFNLGDARSDAERIRTSVVRKDHRRAEVEFVDHTYDAQTKTVALRYRADVGPLVRVEVEGVPRKAVRRQLPFRNRNQEYTEDVIEQAAEAMIRSYQQRGHFNAAVDTESGLRGDVWVATFKVNPGPRYRLTDVTFSGNLKIPDKELERLVATTPRGGFRRIISSLFRRPTGVTREQLEDDRDAIESHYRLQGFSVAEVETPNVLTRPDGTMVVDFPVIEGPQTIVSEVRVEGTEQVDRDDLPRLQLGAGDPLNPQLVREDVVTLQTFYANRGNAEVQIASDERISEDRTSAVVTYTVSEGPRIEVGEVIVRGNTYTNSEVILRTSDLDEGDPFSYTSILEAQRNLYRLGIFNRVDVQPEQAGTSLSDRNVVIAVEEGRNLTITGSVGARFARADDEVAPRLAGAMAHRNLFGTGRFLGLEGVVGPDEREAIMTYREPFVGRYDVPVLVTLFQTEDGTVKERHVLQRGGSIEASKVSRYRTRWSLQYQYKLSECQSGTLCDRADELFVPGLDRSLLDIEISSITPTFFWDRRDDVIDPHRGFFTSASVEYAFPLFSAETKFFKEFVQGAWYIPVSARSVFALSARAGLIQPRTGDDPATVDVDESLFVPVAERFTAGGDTSHRAYPLDLLGTLCGDLVRVGDVDVTVPLPGAEEGCVATLVDLDNAEGSYRLAPLGGNSEFIFNAEYRFPIFSTLGGAIFVDAGNVFAGSKIDFDNLRYGVGAGIRYLSPVGPLRIDIGWPLERRIYDRTFTYSITLGYAF